MVSSYCHLISEEEAKQIKIREIKRRQRFNQVTKTFEKLKQKLKEKDEAD